MQNQNHPIGTWISIGDPAVVEINAALGFDFVLIDLEHTATSLETLANMIRAAEAVSDTTEPIVRIPDNDPVTIKRVLDIGVRSIMIPMLNSRAEAESLVNSARYPPEGIRGIAGSRATDYGLNIEEYVSNANDSLFTIVQIETKQAVENVEAIAAIDGIDALFVGPADLSGSLDVFGQLKSPEFKDALDSVLMAGSNANVPVGTLAIQLDKIESLVRQNYDYFIVGKDANHLSNMGREVIRRFEEALNTSVEGVGAESD